MGTKTMLTPEDLLAMPENDQVRYELSEGELVVVGTAKARHENIKMRIVTRFILYVQQCPGIGAVYSESLFPLGPHTARIPDAAFVGAAKAALIKDEEVLIPVAPDIAVEVISRSETNADMDKKVHEYLQAGVQEVWQFYAEDRRVRVHTNAGCHELTGEQLLETPVLPGFSAPVSSFFA